MKRKHIISQIVEEVILALASLLIMLPIYYFVIGAFKSRSDITKFPIVINPEMISKTGLDNFKYVLDHTKLIKALLNTGTITLVAMIIVVICGSLAGFVIARVDRKIFKSFYAMLVSLMVIPFIGCLIPLVVQSTRIGTYNTLLGCILIQAAWNLPFSIFLYTGFMRALPKELEEAAYIDGCSMIGTYFRVFLPLLAPVTATCCIRAGVGMWNDYLVSSALLSSSKMPTLMVSIRMFFGSRVAEYGYAFAGIILASLPIIILFLFLQKYFIKGLAAGAVKG